MSCSLYRNVSESIVYLDLTDSGYKIVTYLKKKIIIRKNCAKYPIFQVILSCFYLHRPQKARNLCYVPKLYVSVCFGV